MSEDATGRTEPQGRPGRLPAGYNESGEQHPLPWAEVRGRLAGARHFWFSTADAGGTPHARPIWGAWVDDTLYADGLFMVKPRQVLAWTRFPVDVTRFDFG